MKLSKGSIVRLTAILLATLILLGYAFDFVFITKPIEAVVRPLLGAGSAISSWISDIPRPLQSKTEMVEQIDQLAEENLRLNQENSILRSLQEETRTREKINDFLQTIDKRAVEASVIGKSATGQQILLINKGSDHGVEKGYPVITENGILIGTIHTVSGLTSHVLLITDSSQSIGAKVQNEQSSPGVLRGEFGLSLVIELVPQDDILEEGQTVVTSPIDPLIPPNLLIGSITRVAKKEGSVFQEAQVVSPIQLDRVEAVSVILPHDV